MNLVAECEIFARTVCFVDNFWEIKFLSAIVGQGMTALEQDAMDLSLEHTKPQHTHLVAECEISAWAVFYVENFGIIKNFFG